MVEQITTKHLSQADLNKDELKAIIDKLSTAKVLVLGDLILDEYLLGNPQRVSREAPVIVLDYVKSDFALGGAANAAHNIAAYGATCNLLGLAGDDGARLDLETAAREADVDLDLIIDQERNTTVKTRIVSSSNKNASDGTVIKQQVLRVDRQNRNLANQKIEQELIDRVAKLIDGVDIVLLSDYQSGVFTDKVVQEVTKLAEAKGKKIVVDTTGDFAKYKNVHVLTPNQPDLEEMSGIKINSEETLIKAGTKVLEETNAEYMLVTRGAKGMALFSNKSKQSITVEFIPAFNLSEVFDVTGAGDTVAANLTLALGLGEAPIKGAILGNLAASISVRKYGAATVNRDELLELLDAICV